MHVHSILCGSMQAQAQSTSRGLFVVKFQCMNKYFNLVKKLLCQNSYDHQTSNRKGILQINLILIMLIDRIAGYVHYIHGNFQGCHNLLLPSLVHV